MMNIRRQLEERESLLHPRASRSADSHRGRPEKPSPVRTEFQRDRDRVLHAKAFRRLKHKTQVFIAPEGDHYRTRLTHTLELSQIARTIARALNLNEDLTEAISLGHDLGHTPFGHIGEAVMNDLCPGGFRHYEQSVRVAAILEHDGRGLNLTAEVLDGIGHHSKGRGPIIPDDPSRLPASLEGQVVRIADIITYVNHDIDDALRAGIIAAGDIPETSRQLLGGNFAKRIDTCVIDVISETMRNQYRHISISNAVYAEICVLRDFLFERVYYRPERQVEKEQIREILEVIHRHLLADPTARIPAYPAEDPPERRVIDYIAGMTDRYALNLFKRIVIPEDLI